MITFEHGLERKLFLPLRVLRCELANALQCEHGLCIERVFGPESAILVKRGDAIAGLNVLGAGFFGGFFYKGENGLFCGTVIPGGQRIVFRMDSDTREQEE